MFLAVRLVTMQRSSSDLRTDLAWGVGWGLTFAVVFGVLAVAAHLAGAESSVASNSAAEFTILDALVYEGALGLLGGSILGLLRPHASSPFGATCIGFLVGCSAALLVLFITPGQVEGIVRQVLVMILTGLVVGAPLGYIYYRIFQSKGPFLQG